MRDATARPVDSDAAAGWQPGRRRFTVDEYYRMAEAGILHEDERVELIDGEIIEMCAIGSRHAACVEFLARWSIMALGDRAWVRIQNPVRLGLDQEPEPDIALLRPRPDRYASGHPVPGDVLLVIEVADTSLAYDRDVKLLRYAAAGIPEVWIVDLQSEPERVLVYRRPHGGAYQESWAARRGDTLSPESFPDLALPVEELLG